MSNLAPAVSALGASRSRADERISIDSINLQVAMSDLVLKKNWRKAEQLSSRMRTRVFSALSVLEMEYRICVTKEKLHDETCLGMVNTGNKMIRRLKNVNFKKKVKKARSLKKFQRAAKNLKSSCAGTEEEFPYFEIISERSQFIVAIGYTGYWGGFHAIFNQFIKEFVPKPLSSSEIRELLKTVKTEQSSISNNLFKLYSGIRESNRDDMSQTSWNILRLQEENLRRLSTLCASICASTRAVLNGELDGDAKKLGQVDLLAGKLARSWILLTVWALYVAYLALLSERSETLQQTIKTARKLPFMSKKKKVEIVSPKTLSAEGQNYDGKYLRINGFVKNMSTKRTRDGKFLNLFEVYEPGSEEEAVKVAVIFEHMGHRGLVNTSYVELFGTWKETSPIADTPVLQLERLKISELKKRYGFWYMVYGVRPWFDNFPNSYHAFWSVRPQKSGNTGPESVLTGAGELIVIRPFSSGKRED
jgi:hypothetical protein